MKIDWKSARWPWVAALLILALATQLNGFRGNFIYDDISGMLDNKALHDWSHPRDVIFAVTGRPVVSLSLAIDYELYGRSAFGYHFVNVAAHLIATVLLFAVARRTFLAVLQQNASPAFPIKEDRRASPLAFGAALLWSLHPLNTEAVTYIIQRCECLLGMFFLLSLYCVIRGAESKRAAAWHIAAVVSAVLGVGCKQTAAVLPIVVLLYDRCFISGSFGRAFRRSYGLLAGLLLTWPAVVAALLLSKGKVQSVGMNMDGITPVTYAKTQFVVILHYLRLSFLPLGQCFDYYWRPETRYARIVPCTLVIAVLVGLCAWRLWRNKPSGFWGAIFFLTLAPTSTVLPIYDLACERRMYLPLMAVVVLTVMGLHWVLEKCFASQMPQAENEGDPSRTRLSPACKAALGICVVLAIPLSILTLMRNHLYRDSEFVWRDALIQSPKNWHAWEVIGYLRLAKGDTANAKECLKKSIELNPQDAEALRWMGMAYLVENNYPEAGHWFRESLAVFSDQAEAHIGLSNTLYALDQNDEAFKELRSAAELSPTDDQIQARFGAGLIKNGYAKDALDFFTDAVQRMPRSAEIHNGLGRALENVGRLQEAFNEFTIALQLKPVFPEALSNRGQALGKAGRLPEALTEFDAALRLKPGLAEAWFYRGQVLEALGKIPDAVKSYRDALRSDHKMTKAANALAWLLATSPSPEIRDGKAAVSFAELAGSLSRVKDPETPRFLILDTQGAAYAEAGQFDKARDAAEKALQLLPPNVPLANDIRAHLELYKAGKPYHSPVKK